MIAASLSIASRVEHIEGMAVAFEQPEQSGNRSGRKGGLGVELPHRASVDLKLNRVVPFVE